MKTKDEILTVEPGTEDILELYEQHNDDSDSDLHSLDFYRKTASAEVLDISKVSCSIDILMLIARIAAQSTTLRIINITNINNKFYNPMGGVDKGEYAIDFAKELACSSNMHTIIFNNNG